MMKVKWAMNRQQASVHWCIWYLSYALGFRGWLDLPSPFLPWYSLPLTFPPLTFPCFSLSSPSLDLPSSSHDLPLFSCPSHDLPALFIDLPSPSLPPSCPPRTVPWLALSSPSLDLPSPSLPLACPSLFHDLLSFILYLPFLFLDLSSLLTKTSPFITLKRRKAVIQQVRLCSSSAQSILSSLVSLLTLLGCQPVNQSVRWNYRQTNIAEHSSKQSAC